MADLINARHVPLGVNFELQDALTVSRNLRLAVRSVETAQKRAIGTLRRRLPVQARRDIQKQYNIKAGRVNKDLSAFTTDGAIKLRGYFRGIGLRNFGARQTRRGVTYAIFRGMRDRRPDSFFVSLFRGKFEGGNAHVAHRTLPRRVMTAGRYKGKVREPLETDYGPTVAQMLRKGRRPERLADFARGVLRAEMDRLLKAATQ